MLAMVATSTEEAILHHSAMVSRGWVEACQRLLGCYHLSLGREIHLSLGRQLHARVCEETAHTAVAAAVGWQNLLTALDTLVVMVHMKTGSRRVY